MSFRWKHFFNVADALSSGGDPPSKDLKEAYLRTAIGRFYFSAFGEAYAYVVRNVETPPKDVERSGEKHRWVAEKLEESDRGTLRNVGQRLKTLRKYRNQADYDARIKRSTPERMAEFSKDYAQKILKTLTELE